MNSRVFVTLGLALGSVAYADQSLPGNVTITGGAGAGNLTVTGNTDLLGNTFSLGTRADSSVTPGLNIDYGDATSPTVNFSATRSGANWLWQSSDTQTQLQLSSLNVLTLFNPTTGVAGISLDPAGAASFSGGVSVAGNLQANGGFSLPVGTTATQGLNFGGDTNLYRANAGLLRTDTSFQVVGNLTVPWGNIGIGTTNPSTKLEVAGGSLRLQGNPEDPNYYTDFYQNYGTAGLTITQKTYASPDTVINLSNGKVAIGGNLGIGVTNPSDKLDVAGTIRASGDIAIDAGGGSHGANLLLVGYYNGGASPASISANWLGGLLMTPNANDPTVTIGAASPVNGNTLGVAGKVAIGSSFYGSPSPANGLLVEGNVGIGTVSPAAKLDVLASGLTGVPNPASGNFNAVFRTADNNDSSYSGISLQGNNIGGSHYGASIIATTGSQYRSNLEFMNTADAFGNGQFRFKTMSAVDSSVTTKMVIDGVTGNVGVGTITPSAKLEVAGDAKVSGTLSVTMAIRIPPSGDLPMGSFTSGINPTN